MSEDPIHQNGSDSKSAESGGSRSFITIRAPEGTLSIELSQYLVDRISGRVAEIVLERLDDASVPNDHEPWLSVRDASSRLGVSERTVRRLVEKGELPATRVGRCVRLDPIDIDAYLQTGKSRRRTGSRRGIGGMISSGSYADRVRSRGHEHS